MSTYYNPVRVTLAPGCAGALPERLGKLAVEDSRVLLVVRDAALLDMPALAGLADRWDVHSLVYAESLPTLSQLLALHNQLQPFAPRAIVGVGGGSVLDVAKSLASLLHQPLGGLDALRAILHSREFPAGAIPWIGLPTTAGTGSEVTCWATLWDPDQGAKWSLENPRNYAYAALVDAELLAGIPLGLATTTGLDAAAHAIESYWARAANPISSALALRALSLLFPSLERLPDKPAAVHPALAEGSLLAGLAFSNTRTTGCHSISYPLTMRHGLPHGAAVAMLLGPVLALNYPATMGREALLDALGVSSPQELTARVRQILRGAGLPDTLSGWGVPAAALPDLAQAGITPGRADNNPVELNPARVLALLQETF
ncbi:MAG: phosphonoacetaldehyde reductase [Chloroflexi bacterium]|nr:phosphonoacetaldehyde reductase [Chloroflexota bacterium]